ncbi:MAG TPA: 16S rRNA (uracil(1498)-N(3))-methyltransferase, partial [Candidatus Nanopelagicaceae bacterium]
FFVPDLGVDPIVHVEGDEAHHAIKVVRIKIGEELLLADGTGAWARGNVESILKKSFTVTVVERGLASDIAPDLIVVQAMMKSDRAKEAIELLTVAGVTTIIPWQAARSIAKWQHDLGEKWVSTSIAAAKQSRRFTLPEIESPITTEHIAKRFGKTANLFVLHESATIKISDAAKSLNPGPIVFVIGPEGGLTDDELGQLAGAGGTVVLLGNEIFRSAHAGFAALSAISALTGRW